MRIHFTKLVYEIENQSVLIQERVCNVCRVFLIVQNTMQEMKKNNYYIYFLY